jgi:CRISPR-associated protein Cas5a/b/c
LKPVILVSKVKLAWGFSVRYAGLSAAQPALPIPPPTTVIGFYAEPLARMLGLRENGHGEYCSPAGLLAEYTLAAAAALDPDSPSGSVAYSEVTRVLSLPYQRKRENWERYAWSVQALGSSYAPSTLLLLSIVVDVDGLSKALGEDVASMVEYLAWAGWRLGSKEGIVAVVDAHVSEAEQRSGAFESLFYQNAAATRPLDLGSVTEIRMWKPSREVFCGTSMTPEYEVYYLPVNPVSTPSTLLPAEGPVGFESVNGARVYCSPDIEGVCLSSMR